ncbi:MarR family transcriptional regulator [Colwellia sp. 1_MG-2023]|uniref:MarR family winged helix-turn-helix transcriptional regulator n=1 Tax=Colwellia sp. 1_MG-2023 TaxID=3062649 RepID=UPI0026E2B77A|nr:MarR family transcriptional regulator [Colwellia sp. 1_MG-2023]MDO6444695.1 MarR family transcriptional regulator [Colwellia sp. 1_MG-2023]
MNNPLNLTTFFPYQLAKLQAMISDSIAEIYMGEFNLSKQEWRVLAILANDSSLNAKELGKKADLEKMPTSRAIKKLAENKLLEKVNNIQDKRSSLLKLSKKGQTLFNQLAPLVKTREQELLSVLSLQELSTLNNAFSKLEKVTEYISKQAK